MAYKEGREARNNGLQLSENPYLKGPFAWSWASGWHDSDAMLRAMEQYSR
jgi:hypothetical protein